MSLLEKLALGRCQMCGSFFEIGHSDGKHSRWSNMSRVLDKAAKEEKGFIFWNWEVAKRKDSTGIKPLSRDVTFERRYLCPDCVYNIFAIRGKKN